jgi:glycosyltransferase involved in cell wall biosynthesis
VAVVASRVGGLPELIEDGRTGLLVDPDDHHALARSFLDLLNDERYRETIANAGRSIVEKHFDRSTMTHRYHSEYAQILCRNE